MAKPELGTKRLCGGCGAKFYDLTHTPIVCPKCGTIYEIAPATRPRGGDTAKAGPAGVAEEAAPVAADAEFVSLEEADAEAKGGKVSTTTKESEDDIEIDETLGDDDDDSTFIAEEEESEDDVTDIIGDVGDDDET
ncbi:MAG: TIGR02300 family protein [Xanthobacteraceae bacterium]|nr:MAG: TIGR02300 family protein [Xanthobacteraceae bacterium]